MYTKLGRILGLAIVLVGLTSLVAYDLAASSTEGKVVVITGNEVTVEMASGARMVFVSDPQTMIMAANESKRVNDIKVGDRVKIEYTAAGSTNTATDIEIVTLKAPNPNGTHNDGTDQARVNTDSAYDSTNRNTDSAYNTDTTRDTHSASGQLPGTASSLPLVGLVGLLLVGAAVGVRVFRMMLS